MRIKRVEAGQPERADEKNTYSIHAEFDGLFHDAAADIARIADEKGTVNKKAYLEQVVARVWRVLKEPAAIAAELENLGMREINNGEAPSSGGAKSFAKWDETGGAQANRGAPAGHKKAADDDLGELLKKHKKEAYWDLIGNWADGRAAYENEYYRIDWLLLSGNGGAGGERRVRILAAAGEGEPGREIASGKSGIGVFLGGCGTNTNLQKRKRKNWN